MSITNFSAAMQSRIFSKWLGLDKPEGLIANSDVYAQLAKTIGGTKGIFLQYTIESEDPKLGSSSEFQTAVADLSTLIKTKPFIDSLINLETSPSFADLLRQTIAESFNNKEKTKVFVTPRIKINKSKPNQLRDSAGKFYSVALLQNLINDSLSHVISANMGNEPYPDGQRKILNFRTGRFATSAEVTRLTLGREGMLTAYYDYMKYPYQTFEPGFNQGSPKSRDPKLLISKSIKEIAATKVKNRMRAILV